MISSCSSECEVCDNQVLFVNANPIAEAIPAPLPPSGRPRRTATMICKREVLSSSSDEVDSPAPQRKATRKRAAIAKAIPAPLPPSGRPLRGTARMSCKLEVSSSSSDEDETTFAGRHLKASNTEDAKEELKVLFDNSNGHSSRVINSREIPRPYLILQCKKPGCGARCTATKKVGWRVVSWDDKACGISASVSVSRSISVVRSVAADVPKQMPETWECCSMHDATGPRVVCMNPRTPHNMCVECFQNMVNGCMEGEERAPFLASGMKVLCFRCKADGDTHAFDMRVSASFLSEALYQRYVTCLTDADVIKTQKEYEARLERALASIGGGAASATDTASEFTSVFVPSHLSRFISQANSSSIFPLN